MKHSLLADLNASQCQAVQAIDGPVLILAGAGSGKTRTLTHRMAYMVAERTVPASHLLAVTFTNKAAKEMQHRIQHLLGPQAAAMPTVGTFHNLGARILREQWRHTARSASFSIFDTADTEQLVKRALEAQHISPREWSPRMIRQEISSLKNEQRNPADLLAAATTLRDEVIAQTYIRYQALLAHADGYDFDDLIMATTQLLSTHAEVRQYYRDRWPYVSVDEYQDTNPAQEHLLQLLVGPTHNICVVGDDYQAIYSWRGARVDHILNFEARYPNCTTVYLTQNYRSTRSILTAANAVIAENYGQKHKELWTQQITDHPVQLLTLPTDRSEATWVRQSVQQALSDGLSPADIAILYRTNAQSRLFEEEFLTHSIPYVIVGGFRFYDRIEIKEAMAFLQLLVNPNASTALRRLARSFLKGIGPKTLTHIEEASTKLGLSVPDTLRTDSVLTARQQAACTPILTALDRAKAQTGASVAELLQTMLETSGYLTYLSRQDQADERRENIEELFNVASRATDPQRFVEEVVLLSDLDELNEVTERITCMTLHAAKGLEFPHVFVVGLEEGLLPHRNSLESRAQLEEERRLLYVGMTRAKTNLVLTHARTRLVHGELLPQLPSHFLEALPPEVQRHDVGRLDREMYTVDADHLAGEAGSPAEGSAEVGQFVYHGVFGQGVVIQVATSTVTCVFPTFGVKILDSRAVYPQETL